MTQSEGSSEPGILIPHANYLPWLKGLTQSVPSLERTDGYLVFGVLKPYKGIERAVDAALRSRGAELLIAGESKDNNYLASLERKASASSAVTIHAMRLNDADLVRRIQSSAAVVVPYPELYNSGVVLLALSLNRPVVVQRSTVAEALEIEFGSDWIRLIDFEVDELPRVPALSQVHWNQERTWRYSGRAHARIYRAVAKRATS
ncbi:glycosyltransferase [Curtobacterium sp. TXMA1]|uniref:glycosyltransferase n=1 Tax=Curtobacterium sp. TXMA1 TaxID=2876939 RepID=UPI001CCC5855|nr:glycosyltransferase [Curtobacterium sp. TXMA1]UBQ03087.1 glycosyltransferase [Curtobacterium sp. TXMA1]